MSTSLKKYFFVISVLTFSLKAEAQKDTTFQKYLDKNISTESLQNEDLLFVKKVLTEQRINLQLVFDTKDERGITLDQVQKQTSILEQAIIHYVKMNHKVVVNKMYLQKTNDDSELLLARMIYIKSKTWCMEEGLQKIVKKLYLNTQNDELHNNNMMSILVHTEIVMNGLENTRKYDRMKYRHSKALVLSNWKHTVSNLKDNGNKVNILDVEYKNQYNNMIADLDTMIKVLSLF